MSKLNIVELDKNIEILIVQDAFTEEQYSELYEEALFLSKCPQLTNNPLQTGVAKDLETFEPISKNKMSVFLTKVYEDKSISAFYRYYKNFIHEFKDMQGSYSWGAFFSTTSDGTLFAKYSEGGNYEKHIDFATYTQLTWICSKKKKFVGGDLVFPHFKFTVPYTNNMIVLFPSYLHHLITPVQKTKNKLKNKHSRFSFSTFYAHQVHESNNSKKL